MEEEALSRSTHSLQARRSIQDQRSENSGGGLGWASVALLRGALPEAPAKRGKGRAQD